ncbi:Stk1 family PASTA domain-containing Ser/Thr kinase [Enterocloster citroniae]|uniref:non-specific serine/threonine protein kinase n=2 Tax=Enterocloster citroniae TaxID=358743 RepID=A0ABV2G5N3_9FIRM|nr:Stk1 family PASTA domain-containing Ser/Thr kinase [Enterocloster citroniae]KMW11587.1 hypothetical protein HMPREF9470_05442 [[Clostridium] citroniae WAL-19142]
MLNPGTYLQNRYEILERIGSGGMSVVYKAQCHTLNRPVAIKVLKEEFAFDDNFVSKFKMEAQAAARLSHPNIVSVYDVVDEDVLHYIVMELIEGITLKNYIEKKGHLESKEAIGIAIQVGQGIAAAHEQHIIHRDIKPQNMIISRDGKVKVADFGIARAVSTQTMNATAVGSVHYISPEQARGGYCDERSDIYSFGITMYEMVTGKVPFEGDNTVTVALAHLEEPVRRPSELVPDLSHALEQIILKCTQKRPDRRYSNVLDVIGDLRKALMNPDCDIYDLEEGDELGKTRSISREELINMQESRKAGRENERSEEELKDDVPKPVSREKGKRRGNGHLSSRKNPEKDVSTQFERIITGIGIVAAILIVAVVLFVFSRLTGLFRAGTSEKPTVTVSTETATESVEVNITNNQTYVPSVLKMTEEKAREELEKAGLKMEVTGTDFSDNVAEGLVMSQVFDKDVVLEKGSVVGVTLSKGSDKVDLGELNLTVLTADNAAKLLEEKGLTVEIKEEFSNTAAAGAVLRFSPETAKVGESVTLFVSKGIQVVQGMVPELRGQNQTAADAMLAAAGLLPGDVTQEHSDTVAEGLIISQAVDAGTMLEPGAAVDYVVSGEPDLSQAESDQYYVASIDQTCSLSNYIGPASQTSSVRVMVRLKQTMPNGEEIYTPLIKERLVVGAQTIPVVIPRIRGAYGVDSGIVEVVDAGSANLTVIASYPVTFFPVG